jgi:hypothetical protein
VSLCLYLTAKRRRKVWSQVLRDESAAGQGEMVEARGIASLEVPRSRMGPIKCHSNDETRVGLGGRGHWLPIPGLAEACSWCSHPALFTKVCLLRYTHARIILRHSRPTVDCTPSPRTPPTGPPPSLTYPSAALSSCLVLSLFMIIATFNFYLYC